MKCAVHPDVDATGYCRNCGKPLCPECARDVRGALYCEHCLAGMVPATQAPPPVKTDSRPGTALALGFIPGLGAVYNGEYVKALIQVVIFGALIAGLNSEMSGAYLAFFGVALGCFYFYMPIDAYHVAKARRQGAPGTVGAPEAEPESEQFIAVQDRRPIGAIVLIAMGVAFLLANFGLLPRDWFGKAWPIGLIALGVWLLWDRMSRTS